MGYKALLILLLFTIASAPLRAGEEDSLDEELLKAEADGKSAVSQTATEPAPESLTELPAEPASEVAAEPAKAVPDEELMELEKEAEKPKPTPEAKAAEEDDLLKDEPQAETTDPELKSLEQQTGGPDVKPVPPPSKGISNSIPAAPVAGNGAPEKTVVCCRSVDRFPPRGQSGVRYELKRRVDCTDNDRTKQDVEQVAHACRQEMKCCQLPNLGHVYSVDCKPDQVIENTARCEERRMKKRMRVCCVTVQDDGWIAIEGWLQRKRCHDRDGQMMSLPQMMCEQLTTEPR